MGYLMARTCRCDSGVAQGECTHNEYVQDKRHWNVDIVGFGSRPCSQ